MAGVLLTGALGQIGTELTERLVDRYQESDVILTDLKAPPQEKVCPFYRVDCLDGKQLTDIIRKHKIDTIYHLAAILSFKAEVDPMMSWDININGLKVILEVARAEKCRLFVPSSIGAFGPLTPRTQTPQVTIQRPSYIYGITKVAGELLCDYYHLKYGLDVRGVRFPGLISYKMNPGGGTTDYAVDIYFKAVESGKYICYLKKNTLLDMMYMPDAMNAVMGLMEASDKNLMHRNAYNITAFSSTPDDFYHAIKKVIPGFSMEYKPDSSFQKIADSWPDSIDDSCAREEWGWTPQWSLEAMTHDMLEKIKMRKLVQ